LIVTDDANIESAVQAAFAGAFWSAEVHGYAPNLCPGPDLRCISRAAARSNRRRKDR
jgi:hypothetical protein